MLAERQENNEIMIDVKFLEITSKSKAKQKDIDALANSVSSTWWKKNKKRFIK